MPGRGKSKVHQLIPAMEKTTFSFSYGRKTIEFELRFADRRTLGIQVHPDGRLIVIAPVDSPIEKIIPKLTTRAPWILRQMKSFEKFQPKTPPRKYISGETHLYLGRQYKLRARAGSANSVKLLNGQFLVTHKRGETLNVAEILSQWYRTRAEIIFSEVLATSFSKFHKYKIPYPQLSIRSMQKRWGSCTPAGRILLNLELVKAPRASIEYVIIHELCHLINPTHDKAFMALQYKMMPDWPKWKERLEYCLA